jgi:hypothetical protein
METIEHVRMYTFLFSTLWATVWPISNSPAQTSAPTISGTTVVGVLYDDAAIIGADSRVTATNANLLQFMYGCKIHILNDSLIFTQAGLYSSGDKFSVLDIAGRMSRQHGNFDQTTRAFGKLAMPAIVEELGRIIKRDPGDFAKNYLNKTVFEVLFVGTEGPLIRMQKQWYDCTVDSGSIKVTTSFYTCPGAKCTVGTGFVQTLGGSNALRDSGSLAQLLSLGPIYTINALIDVDAILSPASISPPIDILLFTRKGPLWLQKKTECQ